MPIPRLFYDRKPKNILPGNGEIGEAVYHGPIFDWDVANKYLETILHEIPFHSSEMVVYDKHIITKRKVAWYSTKEYVSRYKTKERPPKPWPKVLEEIKKRVEEVTGVKYDACLLNLYQTGEQGMAWHNDEEDIHPDSNIASLSFGAERRFDFRSIESNDNKKNRKTISIVLEHGALLIMRGIIQKYWEHQVPKSKIVKEPRINITFRKS